MYLSFNWLKDFVDIPRSITPEELGLRLTMHTVEIDNVERQADKFAGIVVGKILNIKKHPNADKLLIVRVDVGKEELDIVCGASNIEVGMLVPVAKTGAVLPGGPEIKEVEIRGKKSFGMLCAEDELGLGSDHSGILILSGPARPGQKLADYLQLSDVIFTVDNKSITHRPDLWSHYGLAREISVFLGRRMSTGPKQTVAETLETDAENVKLGVEIKDLSLCPRYMAVAMSGVKIGASPKWMRERLIAVGMRPINNVVDVTNYVMLELGQPMHAFDLAGISGDKHGYRIVVRQAKKGEKIKTLDERKRELDDGMLVIADNEKPIAVAGVMGGAISEIGSGTTMIVLEAANFNFVSVRKTAQKLSLRTEASMRFEKSLDPYLCERALARAVELIKEICRESRIVSQVVDIKKIKLDRGPVDFDMDWLSRFMGVEIKTETVEHILSDLGFAVERSGRKFSVIIPTWRAGRDVSCKEDIAEEIIRIYGYDNIIPVMPKVEIKIPPVNPERELIKKTKEILAGSLALTEVSNYSFVGKERLEKVNLDYSNYLRLLNPISLNLSMLRQSLAPNLIFNIKTNQARFEEIKLFEIGSIYLSVAGEEDAGGDGKRLPYQEKRIGLIMAGNGRDVFYALKGMVVGLFDGLGLSANFYPLEIVPAWAEPDVSAGINVNRIMVGTVCGLASGIKRSIGIKKEIALAEISLKELLDLVNTKKGKKYRPYEKYPPLVRDLAFVVNKKILFNAIKDEIVNFHKYIKSVELFDVYTGGKLGRDEKNLAFHIVYQAGKTLTAEEVDGLQEGLIKKMENKFEARIRDF